MSKDIGVCGGSNRADVRKSADAGFSSAVLQVTTSTRIALTGFCSARWRITAPFSVSG